MEEENKEAKKADENVRITETTADGVKSSTMRFHTPSICDAVSRMDPGSSVRIEITDAGADTPRVLAEGARPDVLAALQKSIINVTDVGAELRKMAQVILDHSDTVALGITAITDNGDGKSGGLGFVVTSDRCTVQQAVMLVNCGDANTDEFVRKSGIDVPGREKPDCGGILRPTDEQVKDLG